MHLFSIHAVLRFSGNLMTPTKRDVLAEVKYGISSEYANWLKTMM
jgi:hypothetical protein